MSGLRGRVAVITGGGSGVGAALGGMLAGEGMRVVLAGRRLDAVTAVAARIAAAGGQALAVACDVADPAAVDALAAAAVERFGTLDVLVHAAGVHSARRLPDLPPAEWRAVLGASLDGAFHGMRSCLPRMLAGGRGHVITIASQAAGWPGPEECAYGIAKAGQVRLTLHLLAEMERQARERGLPAGALAAHVLCPGGIDTPMRDAFHESPGSRARLLAPADLGDLVLALLREPGLGHEALAARFAARFRIGPVGIFAPHPAVIRLWREAAADGR